MLQGFCLKNTVGMNFISNVTKTMSKNPDKINTKKLEGSKYIVLTARKMSARCFCDEMMKNV